MRDTLNTTVLQTKITRKTEILDFVYDESGRPFALIYTNGADDPVTYYYVLNLQGDVVGLADENGVYVAQYTYNAWGEILDISGDMAAINPLRYRGYYYDTETGFYYLQSRYYDPVNHRFINADSYASTNPMDAISCNMFAYCENNPVNLSDNSGHEAVAIGVGAIVGLVVAVAVVSYAATKFIGSIVSEKSKTADRAARKNEKNNSVYILKDDKGVVQYVGRTNNVVRRKAAHRANPDRAELEFEVIASELSLQEARALEQAGMVYYHTLSTAQKMNNQINGVAPKYWGAFKEIALGVLKYRENVMTNEILYWAGS